MISWGRILQFVTKLSPPIRNFVISERTDFQLEENYIEQLSQELSANAKMAMKEHGEAFVEKDVGMENFKEEILDFQMKFGTTVVMMETMMTFQMMVLRMGALPHVG